MTGAGFTPSQADRLRKAMATFKYTQGVGQFKAALIEGMAAGCAVAASAVPGVREVIEDLRRYYPGRILLLNAGEMRSVLLICPKPLAAQILSLITETKAAA